LLDQTTGVLFFAARSMLQARGDSFHEYRSSSFNFRSRFAAKHSGWRAAPNPSGAVLEA